METWEVLEKIITFLVIFDEEFDNHLYKVPSCCNRTELKQSCLQNEIILHSITGKN